VIFDLDGTLVDSLPGIAASLNRALAACGLPGHEHRAVRAFIGSGARELARRALPPEAGGDDALAGRVEAWFRDDYARTWREGTVPYAGIPEMLAELAAAGTRLAVLSNKPHAFTVAMVAELLPGPEFAVVLGQREGIPRKPHPAAALQAVQAMGLGVPDVVVAGDSTIDIETARQAGLAVVAVTWGYHDCAALADAGPDRMLDQVAQLRELGAARS
jgi:phosphoglycolate phosphatase